MPNVPEDFFPLYYKPGINEGDEWRFQDDGQTSTIDDSSGDIKDILYHSNGHNSQDAILKHFEQKGVDPDHIARIIKDLRQLGIIIDGREIAIAAHSSTTNPPVFSRSLTHNDVLQITYNDTYQPRQGKTFKQEPIDSTIGRLSLARESCRDFITDPVELTKLITCLKNAYSEDMHPVPSAGGLYPLRHYLIQKIDSTELPQGLYSYDHKTQNLLQIKDRIDEIDLSYVFGNEELLHNAPSIIVIAADLYRQNSKYANRGYRYTLLEAGHSAQNILLTANELGLSTLEFGGFRDDDLAEAFGMPEEEQPLTTIALGYQNTDQSRGQIFDTEKIKGPDMPVEWSFVDFSSSVAKLLRFYKATAKFRKPNQAYSDNENMYASGTASSPQMAETKATAEAYERYIAGQVRYDIFEAAVNLGENKWLSPDLVRPLSDVQIQQSYYLEGFDPEKPIHWIKGKRANCEEIYVPIDLVFYPIDVGTIGRLLVAETDSSGMAAHTEPHEAARRAVLELVERDAIMRCWFSKEGPARVNVDNLPEYYQKRAAFWHNLGKVFEVLDFSHDDIAIAGVVIRSEDGGYPFMVNGASASNASFEDALKKASQEAELGMAEFVTSEHKVKKLQPVEVYSPADHANFYAYSDYKSEVEWLWNGPAKDKPEAISGNTDPLETYKPITIELTDTSAPLHIARAIVPQLVPITFGYGREVYMHPSIIQNGYKPSSAPHFFA